MKKVFFYLGGQVMSLENPLETGLPAIEAQFSIDHSYFWLQGARWPGG